MLVYQTNPVGLQLFSYVTTFFCRVGVQYQTNPVGLQLFSYSM